MADPLLEKTLDHFLHPQNAWLYAQDIHRAMTGFTGTTGPVPEAAFDFFLDWLAFDFVFRPGTNLVSYAAAENPMQFPDAQLQALRDMQESRYDFFEVAWSNVRGIKQFTSVRTGEVCQLGNGERLRKIRSGEVIVCRIARQGALWHLMMDMGIGMYKPSTRDRKQMKAFPTLNSKVVYEEIVRINAVPLEAELLDSGEMLVSGFAPGSHGEDDNCAICRATRAAKEEGRSLGHDELLQAFEEANQEQKKKRSG